MLSTAYQEALERCFKQKLSEKNIIPRKRYIDTFFQRIKGAEWMHSFTGQDGCYQRTTLIQGLLKTLNVKEFGSVQINFSQDGPWSHHTSPYVTTKDGDFVLDPLNFEDPVSVEDWLDHWSYWGSIDSTFRKTPGILENTPHQQILAELSAACACFDKEKTDIHPEPIPLAA